MKAKTLLLWSIGIASLSVGGAPMAHAVDIHVPLTQQEQLQQDRVAQWERQQRLEAADTRPTDYIEFPKDVPSEQGTSFFVSTIHLQGVSKQLSFLRDITHSYEKQSMTVSDITNLRNALQRVLLH